MKGQEENCPAICMVIMPATPSPYLRKLHLNSVVYQLDSLTPLSVRQAPFGSFNRQLCVPQRALQPLQHFGCLGDALLDFHLSSCYLSKKKRREKPLLEIVVYIGYIQVLPPGGQDLYVPDILSLQNAVIAFRLSVCTATIG